MRVARSGAWGQTASPAKFQLPVSLSADTLVAMNESKPLRVRLPHGPWLTVFAVFMVVLAVGVSLLFPYYQQWKAVKDIEALGCKIYTEPVGPEWLHDWLSEDWSKGFVRVQGVRFYARLVWFESGSIVTEVTDSDIQHIGSFREMTSLGLGGTQITNNGLGHLANLSKLEHLDLRDTQISDAGLKHLTGLSKLKSLALANTNVSEEGVKKLQKALPHCQIISPIPTEIVIGIDELHNERMIDQ